MDYKKTYKSDIYLMIPYTSKRDIIIKENEAEVDEYTKEFLESINKYSTTQCREDVTKEIERYFIGKNNLCCMSFDYEQEEVHKEPIYMFISKHKKTGIYMLILMNLKNEFSPTHIQDQLSTDNIYIYDGEQRIHVDKYMMNKYGFERCGTAKNLISISNKPEDEMEFKCMLSSETYKPDQTMYYLLDSKEINNLANNNFSQYKYYELYASKYSVVYILNTFSDDLILNIQDEITILYIMELIMFQSASVLRTNNRVIKELSKEGTVSLKFIEELYREFGKTIKFWNKDIFKYETVQFISTKINDAFETHQIYEEYTKNQQFLEHIVSLKDIQDSNRESKILNIIVLILTIIQVIPLIFNFLSWIFKFEFNIDISNDKYWFNTSIVLLIIIIVIVRGILVKNKKKKIGMKV